MKRFGTWLFCTGTKHSLCIESLLRDLELGCVVKKQNGRYDYLDDKSDENILAL